MKKTTSLRGNLTSKEDYYGSYAYSWDWKNRLIEVRRSFANAQDDVDLTIKYAYDSKDRRTSKVVSVSASGDDSSDVITHTYKYDGWSVMEETILRSFVGADAPPQDDAEVKIKYTYKDDNTPQAITLGNSTYYYLTDGHGDIREITDKQGNTLRHLTAGTIFTAPLRPHQNLGYLTTI